MLDTYLAMLNEGYYEAKFAFKGLADANVWKRPAARLLSIGEIAGHVAFWEACRFAGEAGEPWPDPAKCRVKSPLIDTRFAYPTVTLPTSPTEEQLSMTADQVLADFVRVHTETMAYFKSTNPDLDAHPTGWTNWPTYRAFLSYACFHVAYHVGQMYSVRHLFGDETEDN